MTDTETNLLVGGAVVAAGVWLFTRLGEASTPDLLPTMPSVPTAGELRDQFVENTTGDYAVAEPNGPTNVEDEEGAFAPVGEAESVGGYDPAENKASDEHDYEAPDYESPASDDAVEDVTWQQDGGETEQEFEDEFQSALPDLTPTADGGTLTDDRDSSTSTSSSSSGGSSSSTDDGYQPSGGLGDDYVDSDPNTISEEEQQAVDDAFAGLV